MPLMGELRSGAATERANLKWRRCSWEEQPHVQGAVAAWAQEGQEEYSTFKVRRGSREKIPLVQVKEQWLHFARAAIKRYLMSKVRETQVRW